MQWALRGGEEFAGLRQRGGWAQGKEQPLPDQAPSPQWAASLAQLHPLYRAFLLSLAFTFTSYSTPLAPIQFQISVYRS